MKCAYILISQLRIRREEKVAIWFELGKVIAGCECHEVVSLEGYLNAQVCGVKVNDCKVTWKNVLSRN